MVKLFCDVCEKEITEADLVDLTIDKRDKENTRTFKSKKKELCVHCTEEVLLIVDGKKVNT